jgi:DNA-directed RNA polymerase subunit RPC12/RpoP
MIDTVLNLLFRCSHRRLTRPVTPVSKKGVPQGGTYVVCLDCGKQFDYDVRNMRIGKRIDESHHSSVIPKEAPPAPATKWKYAVMAAFPIAMALGVIRKGKKPAVNDR